MTEETKNRIIEMAWEDRTPFDAIKDQFDMSEKDVIKYLKVCDKVFFKMKKFILSKKKIKKSHVRFSGFARLTRTK